MQSEAIKFDNVFDTIKHLQTEKSRLEETLKDLRARRAALEERSIAASAHRLKAENRRRKSAETLKMVQHKIAQTQSQLGYLRTVFDQKNEVIKNFQMEKENELTKQFEESAVFDAQLEVICEKIKQKWQNYSPANLSSKVCKETDTLKCIELEAAEVDDELQETMEEMKKLQLEKDGGEKETTIPAFIQRQMQAAAMEEQKKTVAELELTERKIDALAFKYQLSRQ